MLSKLSQTFLQNLIIHPADRRGYTKSNSPGTQENSWRALSDLARTKRWIRSDVLSLSSYCCFYNFLQGLFIKCGSGLCMLGSLLGTCRLTALALHENTSCGFGHTQVMRWRFVFVVTCENIMSLQKLSETKVFSLLLIKMAHCGKLARNERKKKQKCFVFCRTRKHFRQYVQVVLFHEPKTLTHKQWIN